MSQNTTAITAFDQTALAAERFDAQLELQKSAIDPSSVIPSENMRVIIDAIMRQSQEQELMKSNVVVPFPSKNSGKKGIQSVVLDDLNYGITGDYIERPGAMNFNVLRSMVEQTPVLSAVVMTRVRQMQAFCKIQESGFGPGFVVRHANVSHKLTDEERKTTELLQRFFLNCGWEFNPRQRKRLGRQSLRQFVALSVRDSLSMDSAPIETELKRNKALGMDGFYAVDGATIRLCTEEGYRGDDEIFALQVVQGNIRTAYDFNGLIYEPRNPRSDVMSAGYGLSETELLIKVVTGFLNAMTLNIRGFSDNSIPKGVLHLSGNYSEADLASFKRYWNGMVKGVNNAWSVPVLVSKDQESKAEFENFGVEFNEMMFSKWMTFLTSIICAIYGMSPAEINFDSFSGGNTSPLGGSDTAEKLAASKDSGLRPLLSYYESIFSDYILADFGDSYVFRWTGVDADDADKRHELKKLTMSVNEMRAELGMDAQSASWGDAPLNPSLIGPWTQEQQAAQQPGPDMQSHEQEPGFDGGDDPGGEAPDGQQEDQSDQQVRGGGEGQQNAPQSSDGGGDGQPGQGQKQTDPGSDPVDQNASPGKPFGKSWNLMKATEHDLLGRFTFSHGERAGLASKIAPLVRVNPDGAFGSDDHKILKDAAIAKLRNWPKDGEVNDDTGFSLVVGRDDWYKMAKWDKQTIAGLQAIGGLESIVHNAIRAETHADKNGNPHVFAVHRLYCPVMIGAVFHRVKLTVKDYLFSDGVERKNLHSLDAVELEGPSEYHQRDPQGTLIAAPPGQAPGLGVSMGQLLSGVKRDGDGLNFGTVLAKAIPTSSIPAAAKRTEDNEEPKPHPSIYGVGIHDHVFFNHPKRGATSGKVLAYGKDGFLVDHAEDGRIGVPWKDYLGHKEHAERVFETVETGEGGQIVRDGLTGRSHFLAGDFAEFDGEDPEFDQERALILGNDEEGEK